MKDLGVEKERQADGESDDGSDEDDNLIGLSDESLYSRSLAFQQGIQKKRRKSYRRGFLTGCVLLFLGEFIGGFIRDLLQGQSAA